jgi:hypothetical protein
MQALVVALVLAASGCGGSDPDVSSLSEEEVAQQAGFEVEGSGVYSLDGCSVGVLLGEDKVDLWRSAGSMVATNDAGNIGVEFEPDSSQSEDDCAAILTEALNQVK